MLTNSSLMPTIPVTDIKKTKAFYDKNLGLTLAQEMSDMAIFAAGKNTKLLLYQRPHSQSDHALVSFEVKNIEQEVSNLKQKGIRFEFYNLPGLKTNKQGIASIPGAKSAWLKDLDGNILAITQMLD